MSAQAFSGALSTKTATIIKKQTHSALSFVLALVLLALGAAGASPRTSFKTSHINGHLIEGHDDKAETRWVEDTLKSLTPRQRIAQMVMTPVQVGPQVLSGARFEELRELVEDYGTGGVIVRAGSPAEVAALTNKLQERARVPLFVAADYERGLRMQMKAGTPFTNNMGVAAAGDGRAAYRQAKITAEEMRAIGVNWSFGPVADINNNPDNPVINVRSFGENPRAVGAFVAAAVKGLREGGVLATAKHFPGHGDTATDTHIGLATIKADRERLERVELVPFRAAIDAGVDAVMTAHVATPAVTGDDVPATLSSKITTDLLRGELKFDGLVITDSLGMGAITRGYPNGEAAARAIKAGADIALSPPDPKAAIAAIEDFVKRGELTQTRIDDSVRRILRAKHRLGLAARRTVDPSSIGALVERPVSVLEAQRTAERSITLLRNEQNFLPLDAARAARTLFVVVAADEDPEEGRTFTPEVMRRAPTARFLRAEPRTTASDYDALLAECAKAETVIIAAFVKRAAGKGTVALPEAQAEFVRRVVATGRPSAVVAFSGPYLIKQFPDARTYVAAYAIEDVAQAAAVRVLFGEAPFRGRLPVSVPGLFQTGAGLQTDVKKSNPKSAR